MDNITTELFIIENGFFTQLEMFKEEMKTKLNLLEMKFDYLNALQLNKKVNNETKSV